MGQFHKMVGARTFRCTSRRVDAQPLGIIWPFRKPLECVENFFALRLAQLVKSLSDELLTLKESASQVV